MSLDLAGDRADTVRRPGGEAKGKRKSARTWALYALLGILAFAFLVPFGLMLSNAFKSTAEILEIPPSIFPESPSLNGFREVLTEAPYFTWFRNSMVVTFSGTFLTLFTSAMGGYIFAKHQFPGKSFLFLLLLMTLMVPFPVLLIPTYLIADYLNLLNTLGALVMPYVVSAFGIFLMRQFMSALPDDLIEAARIDGASELLIFRKIVVPLVRAPLAALGIFTFIAAWNDYLWPLVAVNDLDKSTLPLALNFFNTTNAQRYDLTMAAATMSIIPVFLVFVFFQRRIVQSLMLTGIK